MDQLTKKMLKAKIIILEFLVILLTIYKKVMLLFLRMLTNLYKHLFMMYLINHIRE